MDAHDIANRIMRKENYLIAMTNKEILNLAAPLPFLHSRQILTHIMEWNLDVCVTNYIFDRNGQLRPIFLTEFHRKALSEG